jgi:hypothetical protein
MSKYDEEVVDSMMRLLIVEETCLDTPAPERHQTRLLIAPSF